MNEDKPKTNKFVLAQGYLSLCFFIVMCILLLMQLASRYIFARPLLFTEEFSRFCYVWVAFLGLGIAHYRRDHIKIDLFTSFLPKTVQRILTVVIDLVCLGLLVYLCYWGIEYLYFNEYSVAASVNFPMNYVYAALPVGCLFGICNILLRLFGRK